MVFVCRLLTLSLLSFSLLFLLLSLLIPSRLQTCSFALTDFPTISPDPPAPSSPSLPLWIQSFVDPSLETKPPPFLLPFPSDNLNSFSLPPSLLPQPQPTLLPPLPYLPREYQLSVIFELSGAGGGSAEGKGRRSNGLGRSSVSRWRESEGPQLVRCRRTHLPTHTSSC